MGKKGAHLVEELHALFSDRLKREVGQLGNQSVPNALRARPEQRVHPEQRAELEGGELVELALDAPRKPPLQVTFSGQMRVFSGRVVHNKHTMKPGRRTEQLARAAQPAVYADCCHAWLASHAAVHSAHPPLHALYVRARDPARTRRVYMGT